MPQPDTPSSTASTYIPNLALALPDDVTTQASMKGPVSTELPVTDPASRFSGRGWVASIHNSKCWATLTEINPASCVHHGQVIDVNCTSAGMHTAADPDKDIVMLLPDSTLGPTKSMTSQIGYPLEDQTEGIVLTVDGVEIVILGSEAEADADMTPPPITYAGRKKQALTWDPITVRPHAKA